MIISHLNGGLGNQMFQYAAGKRLAAKNGAELKIDTSALGKERAAGVTRKYNLHVFDIADNFATEDEITLIKKGRDGLVSAVKKKLGFKTGSFEGKSFIAEKHFNFDPEILTLGNNIYLQGYWQSEKYFADIEDVIRKDFTVKIPPMEENQKMMDQITSQNSTSLHIRRGDYVSDEKTHQFHGICSLDYYSRGAKMIAEKNPDVRLFIFSDDISWAKENLKLDFPMTFVDINDDEHNYEDMRLMSKCRHHIVANSSFSWWGAWLNPNPEKIVIAPKKWFTDSNVDTSDLIPETWTRI